MNIEITIIKVEDGSTSKLVEHDWHFTEFWFKEGNGCCDCNIHDFFNYGLGLEQEDIGCSKGKYKVKVRNIDNNEIVYSEV